MHLSLRIVKANHCPEEIGDMIESRLVRAGFVITETASREAVLVTSEPNGGETDEVLVCIADSGFLANSLIDGDGKDGFPFAGHVADARLLSMRNIIEANPAANAFRLWSRLSGKPSWFPTIGYDVLETRVTNASNDMLDYKLVEHILPSNARWFVDTEDAGLRLDGTTASLAVGVCRTSTPDKDVELLIQRLKKQSPRWGLLCIDVPGEEATRRRLSGIPHAAFVLFVEARMHEGSLVIDREDVGGLQGKITMDLLAEGDAFAALAHSLGQNPDCLPPPLPKSTNPFDLMGAIRPRSASEGSLSLLMPGTPERARTPSSRGSPDLPRTVRVEDLPRAVSQSPLPVFPDSDPPSTGHWVPPIGVTDHEEDESQKEKDKV